MDGSEAELSICAGDYLLVWGNGEPAGGYYDAELLDGRRGLVPASFVQRLVGKCCYFLRCMLHTPFLQLLQNVSWSMSFQVMIC